jgi:hypothetical protein
MQITGIFIRGNKFHNIWAKLLFFLGFGATFVMFLTKNLLNMLRYSLLLLLTTHFLCLGCTSELEKKSDSNEARPEKESASKPSKRDTLASVTDTTNQETLIEKNFGAQESDLKKPPLHEEVPEKQPNKEPDKQVVEVPIKPTKHMEEVIKEARAKYAVVGNYHHGLAVVKSQEGKYGYIDTEGKEIGALTYDFAEDLAGEPALARIRIKDKVGCIDKTGSVVIPLKYRYIDKFFKGIAQVRLIDGESYYIDKQGNYLCEVVSDYHEGIAKIKKGTKIGYIDSYGKVIISPQYSYGTHFANGHAEVKVGEKYSVINTKGECVKDCE